MMRLIARGSLKRKNTHMAGAQLVRSLKGLINHAPTIVALGLRLYKISGRNCAFSKSGCVSPFPAQFPIFLQVPV